jgi:hypothetical protein
VLLALVVIVVVVVALVVLQGDGARREDGLG